MKVLLAIDGLGTGGSERSVAELLPLLPPAGVDPVVVCLYHRRQGIESEVVRAGYDVRFLPARRSLARARQLRRIVAAEKPDIVHATLLESNLVARLGSVGLPSIVLSSLVGMPYTAARLREDPLVRSGKLRLVKAADGWTARHLTAHFHAITHAVKEWAVRSMRIPPERITVIERGRDPTRLGRPSPERRAAARARLGLRDDQDVIVNVGRQEFPKGQRYLLEAMEGVTARRPDAVLLIVGREGNASAGLREIAARPGVRRATRFLGYREDVPDILAAADLFVFPSLYEGQGGSVVEALALGLPMVVSDIPALRETSDPGGNALLVEPASPPALAGAITELLEDPDRRRAMGLRSRRMFEERFTLDRSARRMVELYERLVDRRGVRGSGVEVATP